MKVHELIEQLQFLNPEAEVRISGHPDVAGFGGYKWPWVELPPVQNAFETKGGVILWPEQGF